MKIKEIKDKKKLDELFKEFLKWSELVGNNAPKTMKFFMGCWGNSDERRFTRIKNEAMNCPLTKTFYLMRTGKFYREK